MKPETIARNAAARRGKKQSPETIAKRIAACRARYSVTPKPKHTPEARAKMRVSRLAYIAQHGVGFGVEADERRASALRGRKRPPEVMARCVATRMANKAARLAALSSVESAVQ